MFSFLSQNINSYIKKMFSCYQYIRANLIRYQPKMLKIDTKLYDKYLEPVLYPEEILEGCIFHNFEGGGYGHNIPGKNWF